MLLISALAVGIPSVCWLLSSSRKAAAIERTAQRASRTARQGSALTCCARLPKSLASSLPSVLRAVLLACSTAGPAGK